MYARFLQGGFLSGMASVSDMSNSLHGHAECLGSPRRSPFQPLACVRA